MAKFSDNFLKQLLGQDAKPLALNQWQKAAAQEFKQDADALSQLKIEDITNRLKDRKIIRNFLFALLVIQNLFVFSIFAVGMWYNKIAGLDAVFSTLVGGTLLETTSLIYIIVKWLFSEIPYQNPSPQSPSQNPATPLP